MRASGTNRLLVEPVGLRIPILDARKLGRYQVCTRAEVFGTVRFQDR